jgi:hypothetical protein
MARDAAFEMAVDVRMGGRHKSFPEFFDARGASQQGFVGGRRGGGAVSERGGNGFTVYWAEN